jgi:mycothiol synthase
MEKQHMRLAAATLDDAAAVAEVLDACTQRFFDRSSSTEDAIDRLQQGEPFLATLDGEPVGFGHVWAASPQEVRAYARVRPSATGRGVGSALLTEVERRAARLASGRPLLTVTSWAGDEQAAPILTRTGFSPLRYFLQMRVELERAARPSPVPDGVQLRGFVPGRDEDAVFAAFRESFADHWGAEAFDEAHWWNENRDNLTAGFDPSLWLLAEAESRVVAFAIAREPEEEDETIGWVSLIGVVPQWRGQGVGEALLTRTLEAFRKRRRRRVGLDVDAENMSGALRLYRKVGMEPVPAFTIWSKALRRPAG